MTARTSWNVRAEAPPRRDIDAAPGKSDHPLFADLLDSRFDESGRLVRGGDSARSRIAGRLNRDLPDVDADELEQAVAGLSRQIEDAARGGAAPQAADRHQAEAESPAGSVLDVLSRLEARLDSLSQQSGRRPSGDAGHRRGAKPDAPARAAKASDPKPDAPRADPLPDPEAADSGIQVVRQELDKLIRQVEALDRNDRSLARAMESVRDRLGEVHEGLTERPAPGGEALAAIAERLEALGERIGAAELPPSALDAVERSYEHLLERIGRIERLSERSAPPPDLWDRLERLRRHVQALPGQDALSAIEDRILDLAERIDTASERGGGGRAAARMESQLGELAGALTALKEGEQARTRDIEARLAELLRRIEAGARGSGKVDLSSLQKRLDDILARVDGAPGAQFADAIGSLEARLDSLAQALDERPTVDLDPLSRQLRQLQGRLDQVSRSVEERGDPVDLEPLHRRLEEIQQRPLDLDPLSRQLKQLQGRLDQVNRSMEERGDPVDLDPLHKRLEEIQQRLETSTAVAAPGDPEISERLRAIEDRLSSLSGGPLPDIEPLREQLATVAARLDSATAVEQPDASKLTALADRLEVLFETIGADDTFSGFGEKIAKLSAALDTMNDAPALEEIADLRTEIALLRREFKSLPGGGAAATEALEPLIKDLASRLDRLPTEGTLTMGDLEGQVDRIVQMMEEPASERQSLAPIEESLRRIEEQLESGSRAALQSVLSEVNGMADSEGDSFTRLVSALSADLSALKEAATSSQHNMRETLAAVHETLESVVKRISVLDDPEAMAAAGRSSRPAAPSHGGAGQHAVASPAQPAVDAAPIPEIALVAHGRERPGGAPRAEPRPTADAAGPELSSAAPQGLLGRLTSGQLLKRATGGRAESFSPALDEADEPDLPLEPGTEEPMNSILENAPSSDTALFSGSDRRKNRVPGRAGVVNRRSEQGGYVADDFLSAARRAAQTAAVEAAEAEKTVETSGQGGALHRLFGVVKARRRATVAAALALAVAFAALQFARLAPGDGEEQVAQAPVAGVAENGQAPSEQATARAGAPIQPEQPPEEPPQPDSALAFGEPLSVPSTLQRNPRSAPAAEPAAGPETSAAIGMDSGAPVDRASWPPQAIGTEALRRAAAEGVPAAQFEVASRYAEGRGVPQDVAEAAEWYRRAAEGGLAPAQYRLGSIYEKGIGVAKDPVAAMEWYRRAAQAGNAKAMHNLAVLYAEGAEGDSRLERAAEWFRRAAEHGVRDSQFNIGVLHARGLGVPQDLIEAYKWFSVAAQSGDPQSGERRDVLAGSLPPEDLQKGRAAASAFRPLMLDPAANVVESPEGGWGEPAPANVSLNSDMVRAVQDLLAARGFDVGPPDGRLGPKTRNAVAQFQRQVGLPATGEIDPGVVAALQQQTS